MMKKREDLSQGGFVLAVIQEEVDQPVMKKSKKQPDFVTLEKRKKAAAKKAKIPRKPSNHTKIKESRNNLAVGKWMKQIISQQKRIMSDNVKYANRIRHNPKFLPKRTVGNARPAEQFNEAEFQAESRSIYDDLAAANRQAAEAIANATPMTPAQARRSANEMSRQINETRASQGLPRRGRPPGSRRSRGTELPRQLIIPEIASGTVQNRVTGIQGGMTPIPVITDREYLTSFRDGEREEGRPIRSTPRRMFESDGSGYDVSSDNSEKGYFT